MALEDGNESNDLSWTWALAGVALFGTALAAPMFVLNLSQSLRDAPPPTQPAKVEIADSSERDSGDTNKAEQALETSLLSATIVPGVGIGKVSLGQQIELVLGNLGERFQPNFSSDQDGAIQHHSIFLRDVEMRLDSRPRNGQIESIRLSAASCSDLEHKRPRQEGLPETKDGISIGSHQSRVIRRLGIPTKGLPIAPIPGPMPQPAKQIYDGITFEYCQDTLLVRAVELNKPDGLHHNVDLLATALPNGHASEPMQPTAMIDPTRMTRGSITAFADLPETRAPKTIALPDLDTKVAGIFMPQRPAAASEPIDLAPQFAGLDAVGGMALAPVLDAPVRPEQADTQLARLPDETDNFPIRSASTKALPAPNTVDQVASLIQPPESQARYMSDASSLALLPAYSGGVDRGLLALATETSSPVIVHVPDRPSGQAVPGKPNGQPSALAAVDQHEEDLIGPLAEVKPGASLPMLRAQPNPSLPGIAARDTSRPAYQSLDSVQLAVATVDQLVASGVAPTAVDLPPGPPEMDAELAEASLGLNRATRRKLQRRLSLIGYDPAGIDGIFGPNTRVAIAAWQADADLEPTGFINAQMKELIEARSQKSYAKWRKIQRKRKAQKRLVPSAAAPVNLARVPQVKRFPKCQRGEDGLIASNQSFSCDVDLLQESLQSLFNFQS